MPGTVVSPAAAVARAGFWLVPVTIVRTHRGKFGWPGVDWSKSTRELRLRCKGRKVTRREIEAILEHAERHSALLVNVEVRCARGQAKVQFFDLFGD